MLQEQFSNIVLLIRQSRAKALKAVNTELISLYWDIGAYIHKRVENAEWGQSIVKELAAYLQLQEPGIKGFSDKNLWRMNQFYEVYRDSPKHSTLLSTISWTHNLLLLSRTKTIEEIIQPSVGLGLISTYPRLHLRLLPFKPHQAFEKNNQKLSPKTSQPCL